MKNRVLLTIMVILFICISAGTAFSQETKGEPISKLIKLNNGTCEELEPVARMYLSKDGKIVAIPRLNALMVKDYVENIKKIEAILKSADIPSPMVRVTVNFMGRSQQTTTGIYAGAVPYGKYWVVGVKPNFTSSNQNVSSSVNMAIQSGSSGFFRVGENVPYKSWFYSYCTRHGYIKSEGIQFVSVSTGFFVSPQVRGDRIFVSIAPGISYFDGNKPGRIKFVEAASEVEVKDGQTVVLGVGDSAGSGSENLISNILGSGSFKGNEKFTIMLTVKKVRQ